MEEIQTSTLHFFGPVFAAYTLACAVNWGVWWKYPDWWSVEIIKPDKPWADFLMGILAAMGVIGIGRLYSANFLIPRSGNEVIDGWLWMVNNLLIYSPIFLVMIIRRQGLSTAWISLKRLHFKLLTGLVAAMLSLIIFLAFRGEMFRFGSILSSSVRFETFSNFPAIFLEGVAVAFLFVRLSWLWGIRVSIAIPSILFALVHIPGMVAEGDPLIHILIMSVFTCTISIIVLYTCNRTKDVIWLGVVHYLMDVAIVAI